MNIFSRAHKQPSRLARFALSVLCLLPVLVTRWNGVSSVAQAQSNTPAGNYVIYLPGVVGQPKSPTQPTPVPGQPTPTPSDDGALFMQPESKHGGAQIKVDAQGGTHMAYYDYVPLNNNPGGTYAYCPPPASQCSDPSKWSYLPNLGGQNQVDQIQLQLTTDGHPRILLAIDDLSQSGHFYFYGECDSNCAASTDNWTFTQAPVGQYSFRYTNLNFSYQYKQSFALDPENHPAFIVADENYYPEPDHAGGYYESCQSDCTDAANWTEAPFTYNVDSYIDSIYQPVLKFTPDGHPRILALMYPMHHADQNGIFYFACDTVCDGPDAWQRTKIDERTSGGSAPAWDLALDAQGRPRVVYFKYTGNNSDRNLFYLWCDTDCTEDGSWKSTSMGVPTNEGIDADVELDAAGRPRVAYLNDYNLGYAWCNGDCTTDAGWQHGYADNDDLLTKDYPVALPYTCSSGIWDSYAPSLSLDKDGNPRIAYDARYQAYCQFQDPTDPGSPVENKFIEVWHSVRTLFVQQP